MTHYRESSLYNQVLRIIKIAVKSDVKTGVLGNEVLGNEVLGN